jgi:translation initiation factor 6 (eIF-6)
MIGERSYVGSLGVATTKGVVTSPLITDNEKALVEDTLKIKVDVSTVNGGDNLIKCGLAANSQGTLLGSNTLGHELAAILNALHL